MSQYVIETHNLSKIFTSQKGCKDISIRVPKGVVYGFLGPNGAGKSTFVRTLLGLIHPTKGTGTILGHPISSVAARQKVGYLPELFRYPDWMTGIQLLQFHADLCQLSKGERKQRIPQLLEQVGLKHNGKEKIKNYSKGMQQRIGLATALLSKPEVLFLDEPTSALDPIGRKEVRDMIENLADEGTTVFLNSHLLSEVENICNHVAIINQGHLIVEGDWRKLSSVKPQVEVTVNEPLAEGYWNSLSPWVLQAEKTKQDTDTSTWTVSLQAEADIPRLASTLVASHDMYQLTPKQPHLEDIFLYWINHKGGQGHVDNR